MFSEVNIGKGAAKSPDVDADAKPELTRPPPPFMTSAVLTLVGVFKPLEGALGGFVDDENRVLFSRSFSCKSASMTDGEPSGAVAVAVVVVMPLIPPRIEGLGDADTDLE